MVKEVTPDDDRLPTCDTTRLMMRAFSESPLGVCYLDPAHVISWANATFSQLIGMPIDLLVGKRAEDVMAGSIVQIGALCDQVRDTGVAWDGVAYPRTLSDRPERICRFSKNGARVFSENGATERASPC